MTSLKDCLSRKVRFSRLKRERASQQRRQEAWKKRWDGMTAGQKVMYLIRTNTQRNSPNFVLGLSQADSQAYDGNIDDLATGQRRWDYIPPHTTTLSVPFEDEEGWKISYTLELVAQRQKSGVWLATTKVAEDDKRTLQLDYQRPSHREKEAGQVRIPLSLVTEDGRMFERTDDPKYVSAVEDLIGRPRFSPGVIRTNRLIKKLLHEAA